MEPATLITLISAAGAALAGAIGVLWKAQTDALRSRAHELRQSLQQAVSDAELSRKALDIEREKRIAQVSDLAERAMAHNTEVQRTMATILAAIERGQNDRDR